MSNTITSIKNIQEGTSSRITGAEEGISEQEDRMVEITAEEQNEGRRVKKIEGNLREVSAFLVAHLVKNPPAMWETWVQSLGWEDSLEKRKATHSSILVWRIPWTVLSMGSQRVGHNWATLTFKKQSPQN